jgi:hypothetical protein
MKRQRTTRAAATRRGETARINVMVDVDVKHAAMICAVGRRMSFGKFVEAALSAACAKFVFYERGVDGGNGRGASDDAARHLGATSASASASADADADAA